MEDLLGDFEKNFKFEKRSQDIQAQEAFQTLFEDQLGPKSRVLGVEHGVLKLLTANAAENFGLMMKKTLFIKEVNRYLGAPLLKDVRVENER